VKEAMRSGLVRIFNRAPAGSQRSVAAFAAWRVTGAWDQSPCFGSREADPSLVALLLTSATGLCRRIRFPPERLRGADGMALRDLLKLTAEK
jgi:hypothetical protein